jgi:hypothetical protein
LSETEQLAAATAVWRAAPSAIQSARDGILPHRGLSGSSSLQPEIWRHARLYLRGMLPFRFESRMQGCSEDSLRVPAIGFAIRSDHATAEREFRYAKTRYAAWTL